MQFQIEVDGVNETLAAFLKVQKGVADLRQLGTWDWVQSEFYKIEKAQFGGEGIGKSGKWKALSPKYKVWKQKKYGNLPINQRTQDTYKSLTSQAKGSVVEKQAQEMTIGTSIPYAGYIQKDRPLIDLSPEQEKQLVKPIQEKLKQLIQNARLSDERGF
jgi:phage gpG-like protein